MRKFAKGAKLCENCFLLRSKLCFFLNIERHEKTRKFFLIAKRCEKGEKVRKLFPASLELVFSFKLSANTFVSSLMTNHYFNIEERVSRASAPWLSLFRREDGGGGAGFGFGEAGDGAFAAFDGTHHSGCAEYATSERDGYVAPHVFVGYQIPALGDGVFLGRIAAVRRHSFLGRIAAVRRHSFLGRIAAVRRHSFLGRIAAVRRHSEDEIEHGFLGVGRYDRRGLDHRGSVDQRFVIDRQESIERLFVVFERKPREGVVGGGRPQLVRQRVEERGEKGGVGHRDILAVLRHMAVGQYLEPGEVDAPLGAVGVEDVVDLEVLRAVVGAEHLVGVDGTIDGFVVGHGSVAMMTRRKRKKTKGKKEDGVFHGIGDW